MQHNFSPTRNINYYRKNYEQTECAKALPQLINNLKFKD